MLSLKESPIIEKQQLIVFLVLSLFMFIFTLILYLLKTEFMKKFFAKLNPLAAITIVVVVGVLALTYLNSTGYFVIFRRERIKQLLLYLPLTLVFVGGAIAVDAVFTFPEDINLLPPKSLLFYPMIGFVVEIVFHIVPLAILFALLTNIFKNVDKEKIILVCIILVAVIEPIYQFAFSSDSGFPMWVRIVDTIRLILFSIVQLYIFKNNDFLSMYSFRLVYYLFWHIIWGTIRLRLLF